MSEAKDAFMFALQECLNRLDALAGPELADTEEDLRKRFAHHFHPNEDARIWVRHAVEGQRKRLEDLDSGAWPPFKRNDAQVYLELAERVVAETNARTTDRTYRAAVEDAVRPLRETIMTYAVQEDDVWNFRERRC